MPSELGELIPGPALPEPCCVILSEFLLLSEPVLLSEKLVCGIGDLWVGLQEK